jgi:hypothetical protein
VRCRHGARSDEAADTAGFTGQFIRSEEERIQFCYICLRSVQSFGLLSKNVKIGIYETIIYIYRVSQEECARLRDDVPYGKVYLYNPKHLCPKLNGYGDNVQRKVWYSRGVMHYRYQLTRLINVCP